MNNIDSLQIIAEEVAQCTKCTLHHSRKLSVPGEGPPDAEIMLIGEGPGFHENEQGRPFVGAAGKFLEELLASIGLRSGYTFFTTLGQGSGLPLFLAGALISCFTAFVTLWIGYKLLKVPYSLLIGMLSGLHTQPAVLGFSLEQADNELPNTGYALTFPIATVTKVLAAQLLLVLLR